MQSPSKTTRGARLGVLCFAVVGVASVAGCCGGLLPSARVAPPGSPAVAPIPDSAVPGGVGPTTDAACLVPPAGYCGADACPPLITWRGARMLHGLGPLFYRGDAEQEQLTEAELYPPHSRFHPVPTAPVFAQRTEYVPPQLMMEPVPTKPHLTPHDLPKVPHARPLVLPPPDVTGPTLEPVPVDPPASQAVPEPTPAAAPSEKGSAANAAREPHSVLLLNR